MRTRLYAAFAMVALASAFVFACGAKKPPPPKEPDHTETVADAGEEDAAAEAEAPAPQKSLFIRLGGKDAIAKVIDTFVQKLASNDVTKKRFAKLSAARVEKFKKNLADLICQSTQDGKDSDCKYTGKDMKAAHKGMKITEAEWNATVQALKSALDENKVGEGEQSDLIALLAPMHDDIVEAKKGKK